MAEARRLSRRAPSTYQPACKPGSVGRRANPPRDGHSSVTPVARRLQQPTRTADRGHTIRALPLARQSSRRPYSVLLPVGFAVPLPLPEARCALTAPFHPYRSGPAIPGKGMTGWSGGPFSVALSLGLHPPDVIRHRMSMEPGLSSQGDLSALPQAAVRPTDRQAVGARRFRVKSATPMLVNKGPTITASPATVRACCASKHRPGRRRARDGSDAGMP